MLLVLIVDIFITGVIILLKLRVLTLRELAFIVDVFRVILDRLPT